MKFCQTHWDRLRAVIKEKGMDGLGAVNGEQAMQRMQEELAGTASVSTYDPLMSCHWMIANNAIREGGLYLLGGEYCPLCELVKHCQECANKDEEWIGYATDAALKYCRENKLLRTN